MSVGCHARTSVTIDPRKALTSPTPLVSVIVPSYNKRDYIAETIDSALDQTGVPVEVVVVDDGSTDGTPDVLARYRDRVRTRLLPGNSGANRVRNIGAAMAGGTHLMFLDADDVLGADALAPMVRTLAGRTDRLVACPWQRLRLEDGRWVPYSAGKPLDPPGGDPIAAWLRSWYVPPCAVLWPRELFDRSGGWDEELAVSNDTEMMLRMLLRGTPIERSSGGSAYYRFFEQGGTLSTTGSRRLATSRLHALEKIEGEAAAQGLLPKYRHDLGLRYVRVAGTYLAPYPDLSLSALRRADALVDRGRLSGPAGHRLAALLLGLERKERITRWLARRGWVRRAGHHAPA